MARLSTYARRDGGRFVVFGSFVAGRMRHDSDLDVMIDVPAERRGAAWAFLAPERAAPSIEAARRLAGSLAPCIRRFRDRIDPPAMTRGDDA